MNQPPTKQQTAQACGSAPAKRVTLVIGRANTGKSAYVRDRLRRIASSGGRAIVLVPEQYTFETELRLSRELGGLLGIQVLSFERLAERVLSLSGETTPFLSQQGLTMVVRRAAMQCRGQLSAFAKIGGSRGFARGMTDWIVQCKRCRITPDALEAAAEKLSAGVPLREKLTDLALLYRRTEEALSSRYLSREDALERVLTLLGQSFASGVPIFLDGFEGATHQHYRLLEALLGVCPELTVTLRIDPAQRQDSDVFAPDEAAYAALADMARRAGAELFTVERTQQDNGIAAPLRHIERNLFAHPAAVYAGAAPEVTVFAASSPRAEAEAAACAVQQLVRGGLRYRDIAVVCSDLDAYALHVSRAFARRGIPVFFDSKRPIRSHALVEMLLASIDAAVSGVPASDFLRIAKSGYAPVSDQDADELELFLIRTGLTGTALLRPFTKKDVPEGAERARSAIAGPLSRLREATAQRSASDKTRAVYEYLTECGADAALAAAKERLSAEGRTALADEHAQVWNVLMELLSQLYAILGELPISRADYQQVLEEGIDGYAIGVVPGTADQVLMGDVNRTRSKPVEALFLLGCNDALLPRLVMDDRLFNDHELRLMTEAGLSPWNDTAKANSLDRLDLYSCIARARSSITFSYSFASGGSELAPSPLLDTLERIVPKLTRKTDLEDADTLPSCAAEALSMLSSDLSALVTDGIVRGRTAALRALLGTDARYAPLLLRMQSGRLLPAEAQLPEALAKSLYGTQLNMSASRLELFNACPFRHMARYGLGARQLKKYEEQPADLGTFYHDALDAFVRAVLESGTPFAALTEAQTDAILDAILPGILETHNDGFLLENERQHAALFLLLETVAQSAHALVRHMQSGGFTPVLSEARFGDGCFFPAITLRLPDGSYAKLSGVIDRIDTCASGVRVIDYKTHGRAFDFTGLYYGLTMQLPLYLLAARRQAVSPAGMYYMPLDVPAPDEEESLEEAAVRAFLLSGVTLRDPEILAETDRKLTAPGTRSDVVKSLRIKKDGTPAGELAGVDEMDALLAAAQRRAERTAEEMLSGAFAAEPVEGACRYCEFRSVCRFDPMLPECRKRRTEKLGHDAFFAAIGGNHAHLDG